MKSGHSQYIVIKKNPVRSGVFAIIEDESGDRVDIGEWSGDSVKITHAEMDGIIGGSYTKMIKDLVDRLYPPGSEVYIHRAGTRVKAEVLPRIVGFDRYDCVHVKYSDFPDPVRTMLVLYQTVEPVTECGDVK